MKYLSQYLVALALAFGAMAVTSIDVHAATVCGPNGCRHVYTHRGGPSVKAAGITLPPNTTDTIGIARSGLSVNRIRPRGQRRARERRRWPGG